MGTKLKNRHRLAVLLILATILLPVNYITLNYSHYYQEYSEMEKRAYSSFLKSEQFLGQFLGMGFILYNMEQDEADAKEFFEENLYNATGTLYAEFKDIYPYLDYRAEDGKGAVKEQSTANTGREPGKEELSGYAAGFVIAYDNDGNPDVREIYGDYKEEQSIALRRLIGGTGGYNWQEFISMGEEYGLVKPMDRTYYYGITEENLKNYLADHYVVGHHYQLDELNNAVLFFILLVAVLAWIYPLLPLGNIGALRIFQAPFEAAALALLLIFANGVYPAMVYRSGGHAAALDVVYWSAFFALAYWASSCLRQIYVLGPAAYIRKRTFLFPAWKYVKKAWRFTKEKVTGWFRRIYHSLTEIDLNEKSNKALLKIILCNFVILVVVCTMWFYGIMALIIYSVVLFFILRKYYNDLREKYQVLLKATNQLAEGNLDVEITEDLGVFTPFRTEIEKIQAGFRKAVEEEVKSQRMKTELVTNVSHDLKTPLTAIITYVNLLKEEKDEEKRQDYISVLERKSLRLKVLIEDLFEISKASSKNVTLHIVQVDIVNLFKQVKLELEDKFKDTGIEFRLSYPEEKLLVPLDSQKTYRIFENLLINISKYALPHTRAYVEILRDGEEAVVRMKNISAAELTFNSEEITERFVRGDASRNTEGSGLGLAIAKSFTQLQKGKFQIETEADLFKVELRFGL